MLSHNIVLGIRHRAQDRRPRLSGTSGLYYLSEIVEEHTVIAKKFITREIYAVIAILFLLWIVDGYPTLLSIVSIASHALYLQNLRRFPIVKLSDPVFIASCALVLLNHYLWFRHFSKPPAFPPSSSSYRRLMAESPYDDYPSFTEVASFFGLCVWLVPFSLFVSLSAGEYVLPSMGSEYATGEGSTYMSPGKEPSMNGGLGPLQKGRQGMAKAAVDTLRGWFGDIAEVAGWSSSERVRNRF
ncbi:MAG: hypothetical protein Q9159_004393 [Coniocarpon cinnabarinum]